LASASSAGKIDIGRVFQRGFDAMRRNAAPFLVAGLVLSGVPAFLSEYAAGGAEGADFPILLLGILTGNLLQAALVRSTIRDLGHRPADIGGSLRHAMRLILPMIGLTLVVWGALFVLGGVLLGLYAVGGVLLATLAGLGLLAPAIMVYIMWILAVPVLVEERAGVFRSLSRSADLTRGSRWRIFGILIVVAIGWIVLSLVFRLFETDPASGTLGSALLNAVSTVALALLTAAMTASLYVEVRTVREGATGDSLAAIFD
jgi:hypothetical protein